MTRKSSAAFTLIEMLIAISIFSMMMLYLYQTYASLNLSNDNLKVEVHAIEKVQMIKKVLFLDYSLALYKSKDMINIKSRDKDEDFVYFQSSHSIHKRINPYIVYMVKHKKLYRLESLKEITDYDMPSDAEFDVDYLGEVKSFRVYKSTNKAPAYLIAIDFKKMGNILLKIKPLNEY
jgi:prepilin-type N-terminal cleavage/methylation domain-containing protein